MHKNKILNDGQFLKVGVHSLMSGVVDQLPLWYHLAVYIGTYCFALILYFYKFIFNCNLLTH